MTASTLPVTFGSSDAAAAYRRLIVRYGRDPHWQRAIRRAWEYLHSKPWQWDGRTLYLHSASDKTKRYYVNITGCHCIAANKGLMCFHMAAFHICTEAGKPTIPN